MEVAIATIGVIGAIVGTVVGSAITIRFERSERRSARALVRAEPQADALRSLLPAAGEAFRRIEAGARFNEPGKVPRPTEDPDGNDFAAIGDDCGILIEQDELRCGAGLYTQAQDLLWSVWNAKEAVRSGQFKSSPEYERLLSDHVLRRSVLVEALREADALPAGRAATAKFR